jgi:hypothetical protein
MFDGATAELEHRNMERGERRTPNVEPGTAPGGV